MVRRSIPLWRRIRALRGQIVFATMWLGAAALCAVLYLADPGGGRLVAIAMVRSHQIVAPESGRIAEVKVAAQQEVAPGTVLAVVEVPGVTQMIMAAETNLRALEAQLAAQEGDIGRKFSRDLEAARGKWLAARVDLERARVEALDAQQAWDRLRAVNVGVSADEVERARLRHEAARVEIAAREAEVQALDDAYAASRQRAGSADTAALRAAYEAAAVQLEGLRIQADANVLRAHVGGVVSARTALQGRDGEFEPTDEVFPAAGQWVQAGVPVLAITETGSKDAVVYVEMGHAYRLRPGMSVVAYTSAGDPVDTQIRAVGAAVEPVPMRQLRDMELPEWGVPVTLTVTGRVLVPGEALAVEL